MIKNYLKIAFRNLLKNKTFASINIIGLAIGIACSALIFEWVQNELSFDQFHRNKNSLYKVWNKSAGWQGVISTWDVTTGALAPELKQKFPEIKAVARVYWPTPRLFSFEDKGLKATGLDVDKSFLTMFSFPLIKGDAGNALNGMNSVVLTNSLATKIFGSQNPIGKIVKINNADPYQVTGVMKDLPNNTQFDFEYLVNLQASKQTAVDETRWNTNSYNTYVQLQPGASVDAVNKKIKDVVIKHDPDTKEEIFLHPASKWHLYSRFENGEVAGGRIETVWLLFAIACLVLLIACINFMNLSTAQSAKRAKEVGLRKTIGADRRMLIQQFLIESITITFIAGIIALIIMQLCLPAFNQLTDKSLRIEYKNPFFWLTGVTLVLITGLLAGSYPAFFLSAIKPINILKGLFKGKVQLITPRKLLVVIQFTIAIILISCTLIIYKQIRYTQQRDIGYTASKLIQHPITGDIAKNFDVIKNELINQGVAASICKTSLPITIDGSNSSGFQWGKMDPDQRDVTFNQYYTTGDFIRTAGLKLVAGRDLDLTKYPSDSASIIINESAVKATGFKDPIGQNIRGYGKPLRIVGVFKDFIIGSPYQPVNPMMVFSIKTAWYGNMMFRLSDTYPVSKSLKIAQSIFKKYNSAYPFEYQFVDEDFDKKFKEEERTGNLAAVFAGLTILISCLGLFGLAAYMSEIRSKEIGIRKVLGASVSGLVQLLSKEFVALVLVAILIASPIGWLGMNKWLQDFSYRIDISWITFLSAGLAAITITILTVSFQAIKTALANPVKSLRTE